MFIIYDLALVLLAIILSPAILLAFIISPKLRAGFFQKIGFYSVKTKSNAPILHFHAVSVGEVNAIEELLKAVKQEFKDHKIVLTTVTRTGQELAKKKLSGICDEIMYFPYDFSFSTKAFLQKIRPAKIIIAETEIWPQFSNQANKLNIPLLIVNGRISPNSYKGYIKIKFFISQVLNKYTKILMQSKGDAQRITDLASTASKIKVMGNLKFDISKTLTESEIQELKNEIGLGSNRLIIAGSTHKGEDDIILNIFSKLIKDQKDLKLMLVPRHPERYTQVEELIKKTSIAYGKRSKKETFQTNDIILLDTIGELGKLYSTCDLAFIGGSFSGTGGHNPLEASVWGKPVLSGPSTFNFKDIYKMLIAQDACKVTETPRQLFQEFENLLGNQTLYAHIAQNCKKVFEHNQGAIKFAIEELKF